LVVSIIWRYACGVAIGMGGSLFRSGTDRPRGRQSIAAIMAAADRLPEAWDSPVVHRQRVRGPSPPLWPTRSMTPRRAAAATLTQAGELGTVSRARQARFRHFRRRNNFSALRQQIQTVSAANIASGGKYTPQPQLAVGGEDRAGTPRRSNGYGTYHAGHRTRPPPATPTPAQRPGDTADPLAGKDPPRSPVLIASR